VIIDEDSVVKEYQYSLWKKFMIKQREDPEFWYEKHMEKDDPPTLSDHITWLIEAGFSMCACHWRLYNFAITSAKKL
jgi:hypothetical protein